MHETKLVDQSEGSSVVDSFSTVREGLQKTTEGMIGRQNLDRRSSDGVSNRGWRAYRWSMRVTTPEKVPLKAIFTCSQDWRD